MDNLNFIRDEISKMQPVSGQLSDFEHTDFEDKNAKYSPNIFIIKSTGTKSKPTDITTAIYESNNAIALLPGKIISSL